MSQLHFNKEKVSAVENIITSFARETEVEAIIISDTTGNVVSICAAANDKPYSNAAALAAATLAATSELARIIGEPGFRSISHRGQKNGILIQALNKDFLILVILGSNSVEGMVRLLLKKIENQLTAVLAEKNDAGTEDQSLANIEIKEKKPQDKPD